MNKVSTRILNAGGTPTRQDITDLLESIGKPGQKREEKRQAVIELFDALGGSGVNGISSQSFHVAETLDSYEAF